MMGKAQGQDAMGLMAFLGALGQEMVRVKLFGRFGGSPLQPARRRRWLWFCEIESIPVFEGWFCGPS